eukprot:scaffold3567_cov146-Isochrysis_galbana.AAC.2
MDSGRCRRGGMHAHGRKAGMHGHGRPSRGASSVDHRLENQIGMHGARGCMRHGHGHMAGGRWRW